LYAGDANAAKVAGHELKALTHLFNCWVPDLSYPMMALVDYRGYRLVGMSVLPIVGDASLVFGSADAGRTIRCDAHVGEKLEVVGRKLNLKEHWVGPVGSAKRFWTPLDLEVHKGTDDRFYVLDLSRLFPPESPTVNPCPNGLGYLFRLLRPEFVKQSEVPLCSDSYSNFGRAPSNAGVERKRESRSNNRDVKAATQRLLDEVIPVFVMRLRVNIGEAVRQKVDLQRLTQYAHASGINLRYLGAIRKQVLLVRSNGNSSSSSSSSNGNSVPAAVAAASPSSDSSNATNDVVVDDDNIADDVDKYWAVLLLVEMVARTIKDNVRALLRERMRQLCTPGEAVYCRAAVNRLNLIFGESRASRRYWRSVLATAVRVKYPPAEQGFVARGGSVSSLRDEVVHACAEVGLGDGRCLLMRRVSELLCLRFVDHTWKLLLSSAELYGYEAPLEETDLIEMRERVRYMNIAAHSKGFVLKLMAMRATCGLEKRRLLVRAADAFQEALIINPDNKVTLRNLGDVYVELDDDVQARQCYKYAIRADRRDTNTLMKYATLLDKLNLKDEAECHYLASLDAHPSHSNCLALYADFLWLQRADVDAAERFYRAAICADPSNSSAINNFACFLIVARRSYDDAEAHLSSITSVCLHLQHSTVPIMNYSQFLRHIRNNEALASQVLARTAELRSRRHTASIRKSTLQSIASSSSSSSSST
jgi:Tfp pilus assembly protein PilF